MPMKVTTTSTSATVTRRFTISSDHPIVGAAYFSPPKKVRIVGGEINYSWVDGRWVVRDVWAIKVGGPVLKKDGTDSKSDHTRRPDDVTRRFNDPSPWRFTEEYAWLQPIVDLLRPTPEMGMMILNESEVG